MSMFFNAAFLLHITSNKHLVEEKVFFETKWLLFCILFIRTVFLWQRPTPWFFSLSHSFLSNGSKIKQSTSTTAWFAAETELGNPGGGPGSTTHEAEMGICPKYRSPNPEWLRSGPWNTRQRWLFEIRMEVGLFNK